MFAPIFNVPDHVPINRGVAPGPKGSLLMGNLKEYKLDPISMLERLRRQYGDIARIRLGPYMTHALAHPDYIKHVLQDNHQNYVRGRFYENFKRFFGNGLLTTDGEFWSRHRRTTQPLFQKRRVETFSLQMSSSATALLKRWERYAATGQEVDIVPEAMWYTLSVLGKVIFNVDLSYTADRVGPAVRHGLAAMMPQGNMNDFIPSWLPTSHNKSIWRSKKVLDDMMREIVEQHRSGKCEASDLVTLLLAARHEETGLPLTQEEVHDEVMTVFLAGHETTGSGLAWALYELSRHPQIVRKLRDELEGSLGDALPTSQDIENLPYLQMVIHESLRMHPPIWGYTRDAVKDDAIAGYRIPAGSSIFVSPYVTHRHPAFWDNPEAFEPERFDKIHSEKRPRYAYFPFGGGPRLCIGIHLAILQLQIAVGMIVRRFDLHLVPEHAIERGALVSLRPLNGILMTIHPARTFIRRERMTGAATSQESRCPFHGTTGG